MPEHWYSNQYLVGSQTGSRVSDRATDGGYGGRGYFDENKLNARQQRNNAQVTGKKDLDTSPAEREMEFHFTSGGYQGSIGTPEAGTSGEWSDHHCIRAIIINILRTEQQMLMSTSIHVAG